jgi:hypothetical protein
MDLILLVLGLVLVAFAVNWLESLVANVTFRRLIQAVIIIVVVLYLVRMFGGLIPNMLPGSR